ncbi:MAG: Rieske 2Fe-2S domain-containing protein [Sutterellaceae bacterium]|nr:Rieske 2Fe-2S domain-containing protein [Burkholderiaceae bacterium]MCX7900946.1 Rieske 2Fe-2S domain-containing protein [Burkholderiaceae bacterium]MDW8429829.1 Rieske 2Fe-2S domain-containing protein [Sutterellaceae bacterium]
MAAARLVDLASADAVEEAGRGLRFEVLEAGQRVGAFVVRHRGQLRAFVNRCAHVAVELDWQPGEFFDAEGRWLICATHGALYDPDSGACVGGPCRGRGGLKPLKVVEQDGRICWVEQPPFTAPGDG